MSTPMLERTKARIEKWRGKGTQETQRVRERIKEWRAGREGGASRVLSPQGIVKEVHEKGLVETYRARREAWRASAHRTSRAGSKIYKKELAVEASTSPQLKIQKGRVAIEA